MAHGSKTAQKLAERKLAVFLTTICVLFDVANESHIDWLTDWLNDWLVPEKCDKYVTHVSEIRVDFLENLSAIISVYNVINFILTLSTDVCLVTPIWSDLFFGIERNMAVVNPAFVKILFCMQRYNCNIDKVCSGLMNDVIKSFVITSTDSHHATVANLLREIIMVRDHFLTLLGWFARDDIDDIIFSICVS